MTAPSVTERTTPAGIDLKDGFPTILAFSQDVDISLWEVEVTPPGIDGGDAIDITTMHNAIWMTKAAQSLAEMTDISMRVGYDPDCYDEIIAIINVQGSVTIHFPDGSTLAFYGYLKSFKPGALSKGKYPDAEIVIVITNYDPTAHVEAGPVMTEVAGT